jgi:ribonucleotide monophosphatase NagD (HAD superfamily)
MSAPPLLLHRWRGPVAHLQELSGNTHRYLVGIIATQIKANRTDKTITKRRRQTRIIYILSEPNSFGPTADNTQVGQGRLAALVTFQNLEQQGRVAAVSHGKQQHKRVAVSKNA